MSSLYKSFKLVCFLHLCLLFYGRGYRTVSAILLLDRVMIIISYRSPRITISLSLSIWSQFAMQASTCSVPRNQEHISYRSPVIANLMSKFSNFVTMATGVGLRQILLTHLNSPTPKTPWLGARIRNISLIEVELWQIFCYNFQIFVTVTIRVGLWSV